MDCPEIQSPHGDGRHISPGLSSNGMQGGGGREGGRAEGGRGVILRCRDSTNLSTVTDGFASGMMLLDLWVKARLIACNATEWR